MDNVGTSTTARHMLLAAAAFEGGKRAFVAASKASDCRPDALPLSFGAWTRKRWTSRPEGEARRIAWEAYRDGWCFAMEDAIARGESYAWTTEACMSLTTTLQASLVSL